MLPEQTPLTFVPDSTPPPPSPLDDHFDMPTLKGLRVGDVVLGRFKLMTCLGRGGMGEVWQAHDSTLDEDIALKLLPRLIHADELAVEDLKNETRRGRQVSHPHIVRVFDFYQDEQNVGIAMELVKGENLAKLRAKQPARVFTVEQIAPWVQQLLDALGYAHRTAGVVHRDLKPANLLIDAATGALKIADFGIARCLAESLQRATLSAQSRGTLCYMSPEQAIGRGANALDDLYAFGATLYELLAGSPPFFQGDVYAQIQKVPPQPIAQRLADSGIAAQPPPASWEAAIMRCLAKQRADRPQSAGEIAAMLGLRGGGAPPAPGKVVAEGPPARPTDVVMPPSAMTGSVAISTSAPIFTVSATDRQTQRSFVDLTRTVGQQTMTAGTPTPLAREHAVADTRKVSPLVVIVGVLGALSILVSGVLGWAWMHRTPSASPHPAPRPAATGLAPVVNLPPAGEDWHVPSVFFQTITQAIEAAPPGQKIRIGNNRWKERIVLSKPVQLIGDNPDQVVISVDGRTGSALEIHGTKGVVIESLTFEHDGLESVASGPPLVRVENAEVTFRHCLFLKSAGDGIIVGDKSSVHADECRFEQNALAGLRAAPGGVARLKTPTFRANDIGIYAGGDQARVTSEGGGFQSHAHHGVEVASAGQVTITDAKITECSETGIFAHDPGSSITATNTTISRCKEGTKVTDGAAATLTHCNHEANMIGVGATNAGPLSLTGGRASGNSLHGLSIESDSKAGAVLISGMTVKSNAQVGLFIGGADVKPDVAGNDFGPNGQLDILVRGGAGGRFAKNTLRTGPEFKVFDNGSAPDWLPDNIEVTAAPAR